jgi:hypothetical protein
VSDEASGERSEWVLLSSPAIRKPGSKMVSGAVSLSLILACGAAALHRPQPLMIAILLWWLIGMQFQIYLQNRDARQVRARGGTLAISDDMETVFLSASELKSVTTGPNRIYLELKSPLDGLSKIFFIPTNAGDALTLLRRMLAMEAPAKRIAFESDETAGPYRSFFGPAMKAMQAQPEHKRSANVFTPLERDVLEKLLHGDHPVLETLRVQLTVATVAHREDSGAGFELTFALPASATPVDQRPDLLIDDVVADIEGMMTSARFALSIRQGRLATLEAFSRDEPWPDPADNFSVRYLELDTAPSGVQQRWILQKLSRAS